MMEKLSHLNLWNLLLILFAGGLFTIVSLDLMHPVRSGLESATRDSQILKKNWYSERTFDLLDGGEVSFGGIDIELVAKLDPFKPAAPEVEAVEVEKPAVVPEPSPPPATRRIAVGYRGFYRSSNGDAFVYVEIDGATRVVSIKEPPVPSWEVDSVNASQLILKKGEGKRVEIPFNRKKNLEVPIK